MDSGGKLITISNREESAHLIVTSDSDNSMVSVVISNNNNKWVAGSDFHPPKPKLKQTKTKAKVSNILLLMLLTGSHEYLGQHGAGVLPYLIPQ